MYGYNNGYGYQGQMQQGQGYGMMQQGFGAVQQNFQPKNSTLNRPGNWPCPKCRNINFAYRTKCNRCPYEKTEVTETSTEGDTWRCLDCNNLNFPHRTRCNRCSIPRPAPEDVMKIKGAKMLMKAFDGDFAKALEYFSTYNTSAAETTETPVTEEAKEETNLEEEFEEEVVEAETEAEAGQEGEQEAEVDAEAADETPTKKRRRTRRSGI